MRRLALLTDGAARLVHLFDLLDWRAALDLMSEAGPDELVKRVRAIEAADPVAARWPRNKASDDATAIFATV